VYQGFDTLEDFEAAIASLRRDLQERSEGAADIQE
jgi:hypothetical protein